MCTLRNLEQTRRRIQRCVVIVVVFLMIFYDVEAHRIICFKHDSNAKVCIAHSHYEENLIMLVVKPPFTIQQSFDFDTN